MASEVANKFVLTRTYLGLRTTTHVVNYFCVCKYSNELLVILTFNFSKFYDNKMMELKINIYN